jgi:glycosyltransferase involved in cell wall biosynthesis
MSTLISALLVKNEADRYLERVLRRCLEFSDKVLVLDDRSTDRSAQLATDLGCLVKGRSILAGDAWGKEAPARAELWDWASQEAGDGWMLIVDADMLLQGNPRDLIDTWEVQAWAFVLWDCWDGEHQARVDGAWQHGPVTPRPWLFRPSRCVQGLAQWNNRGLHCGHAPVNLSGIVGIAPPALYYYKHLAYCKVDDRIAKHRQYLSHAAQLSPFERQHAASIAD